MEGCSHSQMSRFMGGRGRGELNSCLLFSPVTTFYVRAGVNVLSRVYHVLTSDVHRLSTGLVTYLAQQILLSVVTTTMSFTPPVIQTPQASSAPSPPACYPLPSTVKVFRIHMILFSTGEMEEVEAVFRAWWFESIDDTTVFVPSDNPSICNLRLEIVAKVNVTILAQVELSRSFNFRFIRVDFYTSLLDALSFCSILFISRALFT